MKNFFSFLAKVSGVLAKVIGIITACGIYDVSRNKNLDEKVLKRYFFGNGTLTWVLSPLNTLLDLLALPYVNKGVYQLSDLPEGHQDEIKELIHEATHSDLVERLDVLTAGKPRTMLFFKWYGENVNTVIDMPVFHKEYKYLQTIGISAFNKKESTSKHFGPFRPTLRVLYNINEIHDKSAYIEVGDVKSYWKENKLFIFDDTLQHQSFNESDQARYCLFVDILRPSMLPDVFAGVVKVANFFLRGVNGIFYKNWDVMKV